MLTCNLCDKRMTEVGADYYQCKDFIYLISKDRTVREYSLKVKKNDSAILFSSCRSVITFTKISKLYSNLFDEDEVLCNTDTFTDLKIIDDEVQAKELIEKVKKYMVFI